MYNEENIEPEFLKRQGKNPFRTPEGYFDTIEDRIIERLEPSIKKQSSNLRILRFIKPAIGIAASILLVYLLVKPTMTFNHNQNIPKIETAESSSVDLLDFFPLNLGTVDENVLANAIFSDDLNVAIIDSSEVFAYLSSDLNEVEIYSEIQN